MTTETLEVTDTTAATPAATPAASTPAPAEDTRSPREIAMDQLAAQNEARIDAEYVAEGLPPIVAAPPPDATTLAAPAVDQLAAQLETDKPTMLTDNLDKTMVKRKIDGVETEISVADLLSESQMDGAARKRLSDASALFKEAKALRDAAATPPVGVAPKEGAADITVQPQPDEATKAMAKAIVASLMEGDDEKAVEGLAKVLAGQQKTTAAPDPQELLKQLAPVLKQQLSVDSALEQFGKAHPDIVSDPYLDQLTAGFIEAEMKDGKSFVEALEPAAKKTRDWLSSKTGTPAASSPPTIDRAQKLERKEGIDNVQSLQTRATTVDEPVQTHSDVIAEMKKQRGLA